MAVLRIKDARGMKPDERMKRLEEFRLELSKLKGSSAVGASIKEPGRVKELRKAVARILTVNNEATFSEKVDQTNFLEKFDQTNFLEKFDQKRMEKKKGGKGQ